MIRSVSCGIRKSGVSILSSSRSFSGAAVDRELQASYAGFIPRIKSLQSLFQEEGKAAARKLRASGLVPSEDLIHFLVLYADLQNPLLKKYEFDPDSFLEGSKEGFVQVHKAIASADFYNHVNGFQQESASDALLRAALHPKLYKFSRLANKEVIRRTLHPQPRTLRVSMSKSRELYDNNIQTFMTSAKVLSMSMLRVRTKVVEEDRDTFFDAALKEAIRNDQAAFGDKEDLPRMGLKNIDSEAENKSNLKNAAPTVPSSTSTVDAAAAATTTSATVVSSTESMKTSTPASAPASPTIPESIVSAAAASASASASSVTEEEAHKLTAAAASTTATTTATTTTSGNKEVEVEEKVATSKAEAVAETGIDDEKRLVVKYPAGSVVATVDMLFEANEEYESSLPDGSRTTSARTTFSRWTFRGCISGHEELDWQVIAFDGYGAN